ncbi:tRNA 2'-phosphotransferase 1 [Glycine soja]
MVVCAHGTYRKNLESILGSGPKCMKRLHVHFPCGLPTDGEVISGNVIYYLKRILFTQMRDVNVLIFLDVRKSIRSSEGMKLYISDNKVILTEGFKEAVDLVKTVFASATEIDIYTLQIAILKRFTQKFIVGDTRVGLGMYELLLEF